jgi:hypothetical protein
MPAVSKAQQKFMGMVHATQKGDMESPSAEVSKAADSMSDTDAKDFASTSHKGLPDKIKEMVLAELRSVKAIQTDYTKVIDAMEKHLAAYKKSKGTPAEKEHIQKLKTLTTQKKKLADELNAKVSDMYKDAELKVDEMSTTGNVAGYNTPFAFSGKDSEEKKGKRQADLTGYSVVNEETPSEIIKDLDKVKNDLIKKVDVLIAKKKKLYSNVDIESPMSADEKQLDKDIQSIFSQIQQIILKKRTLKESVNEGKYYITYNKGRGQGKGLEKEFDKKAFKTTDKPKVFNSFKDAKEYAEKMEKMFRNSIGGSTAYWVSDEKMNRVEESVNESDLKGYLVADVVDDIIKSIGTRFVSGEIKQSNKNKIYLKLKDVKFGSGVVKILKSRFGIDAKEEMFGGKDKFGSIPSVSFFANKVVSESVNEDKVYIDFLNKKKGFKQDRIKFNSYEDAVKWARKNFEKFNADMIKYESMNEAIQNAPAKNGKELADFILRHYDFYTDYIDDGGQRRRAIKSNEGTIEWFDSHPIDLKKEALKILQSKVGSSGKSQIQRVFGKSTMDK